MSDEKKNVHLHVSDSQSAHDVEGQYKDGDDVGSSIVEQIHEKRLTWKQTAGLLLLEYIVLAIMALASSFSTLGMAGGVLATVLIGLITLYTSHVLWQYCMKHPNTRDVCDIAYNLAGGGKWGRIAWWATLFGFLANNIMIMGLHSVAGSVSLNTLSEGATCTQVFAVVITILMFAGSLIREFKHMSWLGLIAASTMFMAIFLAMIFVGVQDHPAGYKAGSAISITTWAPPGTTFVQGFSACLNIIYTYVGQIMLPSFIGDMAHPEEFPKALYACITIEIILYTLGGAIIYWKVGYQYVTAPAYGVLQPKYSKTVAAFVLPTIIIIGCLYSLISTRVIFFQIFPKPNSIHRKQHTWKGWSIWVGITTALWIVAYIIGQAVPFFNDLLSLISSLFDSWFGFIFWGFAYFEIHRGKWFKGLPRALESLLNVLIILIGFFIFIAGTYASIKSILNSYATGNIKKPFQCTNNGF